MAGNVDLTIRRPASASGIVGMPPIPPVGGVASVRMGATRAADTYVGSKSVNPFGLQAFSENRQMRGLLKSNMSAVRHRMSMNIINNIGTAGA